MSDVWVHGLLANVPMMQPRFMRAKYHDGVEPHATCSVWSLTDLRCLFPQLGARAPHTPTMYGMMLCEAKMSAQGSRVMSESSRWM